MPLPIRTNLHVQWLYDQKPGQDLNVLSQNVIMTEAIEEAMSATFEHVEPTADSETSFLPLLLLLGLVIVGLWFWNRSDSSGAAAPAAPKPSAEELRKKRLEALEANPPPPVAPAPVPTADGLRKRSEAKSEVKREETAKREEAAKAEIKQKDESKGKDVAPAPIVPKTESAPKPEVKPQEVKPEVCEKVSGSTLSLRARGTLKGTSHVRNVEVKGDSSVQQLQSEVLKAFPEAAGSKVRIFFNGKELKALTEKLDSLGLSNNICLQVMFSPVAQKVLEAKEEVKKEAEVPTELPAPEEEALSVRIQSTVKGQTNAYVIKELTTCSRVLDLEALSLGAFAPGDQLRPRLFFMGKELKDDAYLGHVGLKPNSTATVQVMFAVGEPRSAAKVPVSEEAPVAAASAAAGGSPTPTTTVEEGTNEAVLAAAAAAGCNVSALMGAETAQPEGTPADAWRAMAGLEEQLSRESDMSEEPSVRQASTMLRQLLTTATHENNSGLMQFAQSAVPDLHKIWSFEPTREHLKGLLAMGQNQWVELCISNCSVLGRHLACTDATEWPRSLGRKCQRGRV